MNENKHVIVIKIGSDERPAGTEDIKSVQESLMQVFKEPNLTIVTHHAFNIDKIDLPNDESSCALVVRLGSDERPAGPDDITAMQTLMAKAEGAEGDSTIVTHHAVDFIYMPKKGLGNIFIANAEGE